MRSRIMWGFIVLLFWSGAVQARPNNVQAAVPINMQGTWGKHGRCDALADRLTITAHTAGWGKGPFDRVDYDVQSGAIFWVEEGVVDNFVAGRNPDLLIHNTQGFDMPGEEGYARCNRKMTRIPWPPR